MTLDVGAAAATSETSGGAVASLEYVTAGARDLAAAVSTAAPSLQEASAVAAEAFAAGGDGSPYSPGVSATIIFFLALVTAVSIGGNVLVCVAILTDRRLRKVSNLFLVSLAVADLVVSCLVMPFAIANDVLGYWPFGEHFCTRWLSLDILSATASILSLCAISLDRFVHMRSPFVYEQWMTTRRCLLFIALTWLASLLISFLPIELGWHVEGVATAAVAAAGVADNASAAFSSWPPTTLLASGVTTADALTEVVLNGSFPDSGSGGDGGAVMESAATCALQINPVYAVVSSSVSFYIPCIVMLGIYGQVYKLARYHAQSIKRTQAHEAALAGGGGGGALRKSIQENKALFTLGVIMGLFLVSWFPFFILNVVQAFCGCAPGELMQAFIWLGYFNSTQNPIIYSIFNLDFREAFRRILTCERLRKRDPYGSLGGGSSSQSHRNGLSGRAAAAQALASRSAARENGIAANGRRPASAVNGEAAAQTAAGEHIAMKALGVTASSGAKRDDVNDNTLHVNGDGELLLNGYRSGSGRGSGE